MSAKINIRIATWETGSSKIHNQAARPAVIRVNASRKKSAFQTDHVTCKGDRTNSIKPEFAIYFKEAYGSFSAFHQLSELAFAGKGKPRLYFQIHKIIPSDWKKQLSMAF
jgi:hypothetical protein